MMPITHDTNYDKDGDGDVDFEDLPSGKRWSAPVEDNRSNILELKRLKAADAEKRRLEREEEEELDAIIAAEKESQRLADRSPTRKKIDNLVEGAGQYIKRKITPQESQFLQQHRPAPVQQAAPRYKKQPTGRRGRAPAPRQQALPAPVPTGLSAGMFGMSGANLDAFHPSRIVGNRQQVAGRTSAQPQCDMVGNFNRFCMATAPAPRRTAPVARMPAPRQPSTDMLKNFNSMCMGSPGSSPDKRKKKGRGFDFMRDLGGI